VQRPLATGELFHIVVERKFLCGVPMACFIRSFWCDWKSVAYRPNTREAVSHPEACIEVGFPVADVKVKEAAH
jgi:hypothetical protein